MAHGDEWKRIDIMDLVLAPASIILLAIYHIFLCYRVRSNPSRTVMGINNKARRLWVYDIVVENHKKNVLAVQTLRNSIMESTLMATTAVLLMAALATYLTFATTIKQLPIIGYQLQGVGDNICSTIKSLALVASLMASFLCHTQSIRFINHVNYMVNIPMPADGVLTPDYIAGLLERATVLYSMGSRCFYVSFPFFLWIFGAIPMFISTVIILHALYSSDFVHPSNRHSNVVNKHSELNC